MAYLTAKEIKQLKPLMLDAKLIYLFTLKPRAGTGDTASATEEETREELAALLSADGSPNTAAITARLAAVQEAGAISHTDIRKVRKLLGI